MKKPKLKILLTAIGFFALSSTFAQVDSSKAMTPGDSVNVAVPQGSPTAIDSASVDQSSANQNPVSSDSTSAEYKAAKKLEKAEKKQAKAEKKLEGNK